MKFDHAKLPLDEKNSRLEFGNRLQSQIGDAMDRQRGSDLDNEAVIARYRRIAAGANRRRQIGGELRL